MRAGIVVAVIASACLHARAEEPPPEAATEGGVDSYRRVTLTADAVAAGIVVVGIAAEQESIIIFSVPCYFLIPPVAHMSKGRPGRALASLSMRVGLPLLGAVIGERLPEDCGPSGDCMGPPLALYIGLAGGAVAASALDAIFLAKGDAPSQPRTAWTPVAGPTHGGFALGVAGQF